jgi:hypothetical protein
LLGTGRLAAFVNLREPDRLWLAQCDCNLFYF